MSVNNLGIVIVAHQPYARHITKEGEVPGPEYDILFETLTQTYLPIINLLHKFENEGIKSKFSIVLTPVLCSLLSDSIVQSQYVEWLDRCITLGKKEIIRLSQNEDLLKNAQSTLDKMTRLREDFVEKYNCNLIKEFAYFARKDMIEILSSCGTYAFLPFYSDLPEILNAQVETGIISHKNYFGFAPDGFYLPYQGYSKGLERVLRSYGISYTILDAQSLLFSENPPETGIFTPLRTWNSLVVFGSDSQIRNQFSGEDGFISNKIYKNQNRDIGFELSGEEISGFVQPDSPRTNTLFRYWSNDDSVYDEQKALEQARNDAKEFFNSKKEKLDKVSESVENPCLICAIDARFLGKDWAEGMVFLEEVLRQNAKINFACPGELFKEPFKLEKITPYPSAASGQGYGEDLLDSSNSWMLRYTRKMCERMVDLAGRFPEESGLKERLLILGAKELLLAQSAELSKMIHKGELPDFAKNSFTQSVKDFTTVFDSLGTNLVSTEWLTKLEKEHNLFPWMNYRIFSKKI